MTSASPPIRTWVVLFRKLSVGLPLLALLLACNTNSRNENAGAEEDDPAARTVIYLTRHAEKGSGPDPDLLPEGTAHAEALAAKLRTERIRAVYSTDTKRTQQTAAPTAAAAGVSVTSYDAGDPTAFARQLRENHRGQSVLVVGHSNTIPDLVNALIGEREYGDLTEEEFGDLFVVRIPGGRVGKARVRKSTY